MKIRELTSQTCLPIPDKLRIKHRDFNNMAIIQKEQKERQTNEGRR